MDKKIACSVLNRKKCDAHIATMRKALSVILVFAFLFGVTSCSRPKSANALIRYAKDKYGDCTLVSKETTQDGTIVVLHDELQDFDYTVRSFMMAMNLDGASFGKAEQTRDTFLEDLIDKIVADESDALDRICKENGTRYISGHEETIYLLPAIFAEDKESGVKTAEAFAKILQEHNLQGRLDNAELVVYKDKDSIRNGKTKSTLWKKLGSIKLPDTAISTAE